MAPVTARLVRRAPAPRGNRRHPFDLGPLDATAVQTLVRGTKTQQDVARNEDVLARWPIVELRLPQVSAVLVQDLEDPAGLDGGRARLRYQCTRVRPAVPGMPRRMPR